MQGVGGNNAWSAVLAASPGRIHPASRDRPDAELGQSCPAPGPVFGSMSPGGPPAGAAQWALPDAGKKPTIGDRLSAAGQAIDNAVMPAAQINYTGGDARQGVPDLMKLLGNPNAYAQALMQRRIG
jgi:hypothetical protein